MIEDLELSVIIPYFRGKDYIDRLVQSLLPIEHSKEIIIIDDGSNDGSIDALRNNYKDNDEIRLLSKTNGGIADTRNYGVTAAKGKFLLFCDQDDVVVPQTIDKALNTVMDNNCEACFWTTELLYNDARGKAEYGVVYNDLIISDMENMNDVLEHVITNTPSRHFKSISHLWSGLYLRETVVGKEICFKSFIEYDDDLVFLIDFLSVATSIALIKDTGYYWFQNRTSRSHNRSALLDYSVRRSRFNKYCENRLLQANVPIELGERVAQYMNQKLVVDSIYRSTAIQGKNNISNEQKRIMRIMDGLETSNFSEYRLGDDFRSKVTFRLLKCRQTKLAFIFNYICRAEFNFRVWLGTIIWSKKS